MCGPKSLAQSLDAIGRLFCSLGQNLWFLNFTVTNWHLLPIRNTEFFRSGFRSSQSNGQNLLVTHGIVTTRVWWLIMKTARVRAIKRLSNPQKGFKKEKLLK